MPIIAGRGRGEGSRRGPIWQNGDMINYPTTIAWTTERASRVCLRVIVLPRTSSIGFANLRLPPSTLCRSTAAECTRLMNGEWPGIERKWADKQWSKCCSWSATTDQAAPPMEGRRICGRVMHRWLQMSKINIRIKCYWWMSLGKRPFRMARIPFK